jgi:electron transport complex protein RnfG
MPELQQLKERIWFMALLLAATGLLAGAGLASVRSLTAPVLERRVLEQRVKPGLQSLFASLDADNDPIGERVTLELGRDPRGRSQRLSIFPARRAGALVGAALRTGSAGYGGDIEVLSAFDLERGSLLGARALQQKETPGLGARIGDPEEPFVRQFAGMPALSPIRLRSEGGQVDAISGATMSSRGFAAAVERARTLLQARRSALDAPLRGGSP